METTIRAKVQVHERKETHWNNQDVTIVMRPVHAGSEIPEALQYSTATPSGLIELQMKKSVGDLFKLGQFYEVDFRLVK